MLDLTKEETENFNIQIMAKEIENIHAIKTLT